MTMKSTYSLDAGTVGALDDLARRWSVSKSEALRRAIRNELARQPSRRDTRMRALRELQDSVARRRVDLAAWEKAARDMRRASFPRLPGDPQ